MENFNTVPYKGTFGGSIEVVNQNFLLAQQALEMLEQGEIDKPYDPSLHSGMGRKILSLKKDGSNVLTQADFDKTNTIYVIRYDFTLGEDITVPENCVLEFDGGSISGNKTLTGNNTGISAGLVKIFNTDVTLAGTWNVKEVYPEWFEAKGDFTDDASVAIQKALDLGAGKTVVLKHGNIFKISQTLYVRSNTEVIFDATLRNRISAVAEAPCLQITSSNPLSDETYGYTGVHDVYIHGNGLYDGNGNGNVTVSSCLRMYHAKNIRVEGISFIGWRKYHCIEMGGCKNVHLLSLNFKGGIPDEEGYLGEVIQFESCTGQTGQNGGYPYDGTKCNNVTIDSCIFEPEDGYYIYNSIGSHDGNTPNYQENVKITNNIFRYNGTKTVNKLYGCINFDYKFKNVVIENNIIYDYDYGIILLNDVTNISVTNNIFSDIYGIGIRLTINNSSSLINIKNNKFFNCNLQNKIQSNTNCPCIYITSFSGYGFVKNNYFVLDDNEWSVPFYINWTAANSKLVFQDNYIHGIAEARAEVKTVIQDILNTMGSSNIQTLFTDQTKYSMFYDSALS